MVDVSEFKKVAIDAVKKAEERILYYFHHQPRVETKIDKTPVTKADKEAEEIIVSTIRKAFPQHGFMGEELGTDHEDAEFVWIIDPIDGTKNFIHGLPFFGTVLGLKYQGEIILGISNMPAMNEFLYASVSEPTTLNNTAAHVSKIADVSNAFVNCSPTGLDDERIVNLLRAVDQRVLNMRGFGDTYGYHLVATGRAEVMFERITKAWDISAFQIIIKQAGGKYSDFSGNESALGGTSLATNGLLHKEMLSIIQASYNKG